MSRSEGVVRVDRFAYRGKTYAWPMVDRDIEQLGLRAFRESSDASLRVFPWQDLDGKPLPAGTPKTKPRLRR